MIITGSLWYGPNYDGIKWFLDEVFPKINKDISLIIAGGSPNDELKSRVQNNQGRIMLIDSPKDMDAYFRKASLSVAPVFDGAGMKVKVAEALSYGLPVVGTSHAFTGYDISPGLNSFVADTADGFAEAINGYFEGTVMDIMVTRSHASDLYRSKYSMESSVKAWNKVLNSMQKE